MSRNVSFYKLMSDSLTLFFFHCSMSLSPHTTIDNLPVIMSWCQSHQEINVIYLLDLAQYSFALNGCWVNVFLCLLQGCVYSSGHVYTVVWILHRLPCKTPLIIHVRLGIGHLLVEIATPFFVHSQTLKVS